jgi:hypothetical protein
MRPCTARQKRFSFRFSQMAQLTRSLLWQLSHAKSAPFLGYENAVITAKKAILECRGPKTGVFPVLLSYLLRKTA